ncbi:fluoride efflux transporter CrcB [Streptomyces sp. NPDC047706]|uniref:fluoride efflux transporter CrcB n=1 Tax=Streptomyces sp. NPDC047706 TaxID=3365486 RepID=UPI00371F1577
MTAPETENVCPSRRPSWWSGRSEQVPVVAVVAVGGAIGAAARYAAALWWPAQAGGFPWATFWVNVCGCVVIGAFMVLVTGLRVPHRLVRPFFGTGVLGGFTTFSAYAVEIERLVGTGHPGPALAYLATTVLAALAAVWAGASATRRFLARRQR